MFPSAEGFIDAIQPPDSPFPFLLPTLLGTGHAQAGQGHEAETSLNRRGPVLGTNSSYLMSFQHLWNGYAIENGCYAVATVAATVVATT